MCPGLTASWVAEAMAMEIKFLAQGNSDSRKTVAWH